MLMTLEEFKKQNSPIFVGWSRGIVTANNKNYELFFKKVNGKSIPYVEIAETVLESRSESGIRKVVEFDGDKNNRIRVIIVNKSTLKNETYDMNNNEYHVIGIGPEAIQAYKNDAEDWEYFRYETEEGDSLLNVLFTSIGQTSLI